MTERSIQGFGAMLKENPRHNAQRRGLWAEYLVGMVFWCLGYRLLAHRLATPVAEIDLLVQHRLFARDQVVIVEVKFRQKMVDALEALRPNQHGRLQTAALWLQSSRYMNENTSVRIDYVAISWDSLPRYLRDV